MEVEKGKTLEELAKEGWTPAETTAQPASSGGEWVNGPTGQTWKPAVAPGARADSNMFTIDHAKIANGIADWASKLPEPLRKPAAFLATLPADALASLAEMFSSPEAAVAVGAKPAMAAMDAVGGAATKVGTVVGKMGGAAIDAVDPDLLSIASPRGGAALKKVQQLRDYATTKATPGAATAVVDISQPVKAGSLTQEQIGQRLAAGGARAETELPATKPVAGQRLAAQRAEFEARVAARKAAEAQPAPAEPIATPAPAAAAPEPAVAVSGKLKFTAPEFAEFQRLLRTGRTPEKAAEIVKTSSELAKRLKGNMTDAEIRASLDRRNDMGQIKEPSAETARARRGGTP